MLQIMQERSSFSGRQEVLGKELVDVYIDRDIQERGGNDQRYLAQAVTNLSEFDPVTPTFDRLS